jgi:D-aminoacyl-tRNA deacylase
MCVLLQRVIRASGEVEGEILSSIDLGNLLFVDVTQSDAHDKSNNLTKKCSQLRNFENEKQRRHQHSALDLDLEALVISKFTLYGNTNKDRTPGFNQSATPEKAEVLFQAFIESPENNGLRSATGKFRA